MLEKTYSLMLSGDSWPGGKDEGIEITASDLVAGIALARQNLRLAKELKRDDEVFANAHWLLGAHQLAAAIAALKQIDSDDAKFFAGQLESVGKFFDRQR